MSSKGGSLKLLLEAACTSSIKTELGTLAELGILAEQQYSIYKERKTEGI